MSKIRVVRILEYTYDTVEDYVRDRAGWTPETFTPNPRLTIHSTTLPLDLIEEPA